MIKDAPDVVESEKGVFALDAIDLSILDLLRTDGRISIRTLAERVHVSRANAYSRLERLRTYGVIRSFTVDIDTARVGLRTNAYIGVTLTQKQTYAFANAAALLPQVHHVAIMSGEFDVLLLVRVNNESELREFLFNELHDLPGVVDTKTMLMLDERIPKVG